MRVIKGFGSDLKKIFRKQNALELSIFAGMLVFLVVKFMLITPLASDVNEFLQLYKFSYTDSYDWFANGLRLFENDSITYRSPGLPMIIMLLHGLGAIYLLPLLNQFIFLLLIISVYYMVKHLTKDTKFSLVVAVALFVNYTLQVATNYLMADIYATTAISLGAYFMITKKYTVSFMFIGLSMLFQNFAYFLYIFWVLVYIGRHMTQIKTAIASKNLGKSIRVIIPVIVPLLMVAPWHMYKLVKFGSPLYSGVNQFALMKLNFNHIFYYMHRAYLLVGPLIVVAILLSVHTVIKKRSLPRNKDLQFLIGGLVISTVFWVFLYDWPDRRFLLYILPWLVVLIAYILHAYVAKLRPIMLVVLAIIFIYPTTLATASVEDAKSVPIIHNVHIAFRDRGPRRVTIERDEGFNNLVMNVSPILYDAFSKSDFYRNHKGGKYHSALIHIAEDYDKNANCINKKPAITAYTLNSVLLIKHNADISLIRYTCF